MQLRFLFLANAADVGRAGSISALGIGITVAVVPSLPATIPSLAIISQVHFNIEECGISHRFAATITNPDGTPNGINQILEATPEIPPAMPERGSSVECLFAMYNLALNSEGVYVINFYVDDNNMGSLDLLAVRLPRPEGTAP